MGARFGGVPHDDVIDVVGAIVELERRQRRFDDNAIVVVLGVMMRLDGVALWSNS